MQTRADSLGMDRKALSSSLAFKVMETMDRQSIDITCERHSADEIKPIYNPGQNKLGHRQISVFS